MISKKSFNQPYIKANEFLQYFLFCLVFLLVGCDSENRMTIYRCEDGDYADSCEHCKIDKEFKFQFLVSKESSSVMQIFFFEDLQSGSTTHKNCIIFNDKNWDCSDDYTNNPRKVLKMSNGKITSKYVFWNKENYGSRDGICSK